MATREAPQYVKRKIAASYHDADLRSFWKAMKKFYKKAQWNQLAKIVQQFLTSKYGDLVDKEMMYTQFISLFEQHIKPSILAGICALVAQYISRRRGFTRRGVAAGVSFLKQRMELCKRSKRASLMLKLGWLTVCADGNPGFSSDQLDRIFRRIEALRRLVDALPATDNTSQVSAFLHKGSASIAWEAQRYGIAYRHLSIFCEGIPKVLHSVEMSEDDRERAKRCYANMLAISALFADNITDFEPVLKHPIMEPFRLRCVLLIFTNCDAVNFYKLKRGYASILPSVLGFNSIPPHFTVDLFQGKMELLEKKFRSMAVRKIATTRGILGADRRKVESHVEESMKNAEASVTRMQGEIEINWCRIYFPEWRGDQQ